MPRYRDNLPQLADTVFLTDGGLETYLVFLERIDLPCFASFPMVRDAAGQDRLRRYFEPFLRTAQARVGNSSSTRQRGAPVPIGASDWAIRQRRSRISTGKRSPWRFNCETVSIPPNHQP